MAFVQKPQVFKSAINTVELGVGENKITLGGSTVTPLYSFDAPITNAPKVGVEISDLGLEGAPKGMMDYYGDCKTMADIAKKAAAMPGADFICLHFEGADPGAENKSIEDCVKVAKEVSDAISLPIMVSGCKNSPEGRSDIRKGSRGSSGQERRIPFCKGRELQDSRRFRRSRIFTEGWRRILS